MGKQVTLDALSKDDLEALFQQMKAREEAERAAAKAVREQGKAVATQALALIADSGIPASTFQSGAVGWQLGGKELAHAGKKYRVSILIRDEATIPAKEA